MFLLCLFGATLTTLYPFHDLSLTYIGRLWAIWLLSFLMAAVCIGIVSLTWYWFHQPNYDTADNVWSISRHALYGGFLPVILILSEISLVHGVDHLFQRDMQFHLWFYAALILVLNMYYRSVGFRSRLQGLKLDLSAVQKENSEQRLTLQTNNEQLAELTALLRQKDDELEVWQNENMELRRKAADCEKLYIIEIGNERKAFLKSEIGGFLINGATRVEGGRSIIEMYLLSGESYIDESESLTSLEGIFPGYKRVTRQLLLSPESVSGYKENEDGTVELYLEFLAAGFMINKYHWTKHKDWIKEIVDNNKAS